MKKSIYLFSVIIVIVTSYFIYSCRSYKADGVAFKILMDSTLKPFVNNNKELNIYNIIYSFYYKNTTKILVEADARKYKIWTYDYSANKLTKHFNFEIDTKEQFLLISQRFDIVSVFTMVHINDNYSILRRNYNIENNQKVSDDILMTLVKEKDFKIQDYIEIFNDSSVPINYSGESHFKFGDKYQEDIFVVYRTKFMLDVKGNLKGIMLFCSFKEIKDFILLRTYDEKMVTFDYFQLIPESINKYKNVRKEEVINPCIDIKNNVFYYYIKQLGNDKLGICMQFYKDGKVTEKILELQDDVSQLEQKASNKYYNYKFVDDKIYFLSCYGSAGKSESIPKLNGIYVQAYDYNNQKVINQKTINFNDELYKQMNFKDNVETYFYDFDVDKNGNLYVIFDKTYLNDDQKEASMSFNDMYIYSVDNSFTSKWLKKISRASFSLSHNMKFSPDDFNYDRGYYPYINTNENGISIRFVRSEPLYGVYEDTYSMDKGDLLSSKTLYTK